MSVFPVYGELVLSPVAPTPGAELTLNDPDTYTRDWPKRKSVHQVIGDTVEQDFGLYAADCVVTAVWANGQYLDKTHVQALHEWRATAGAELRLSDGEGNEFTVTINSFAEKRAVADLYHGSLELQVTSMTAYLGQAYTGN